MKLCHGSSKGEKKEHQKAQKIHKIPQAITSCDNERRYSILFFRAEVVRSGLSVSQHTYSTYSKSQTNPRP